MYRHLAAFMSQKLTRTDGKAIKFDVWDTAGQERYHSLAPMYYRGAKVRDSFDGTFTCICAFSWVSVMIYGSMYTSEVLVCVIMFRFSTESDDK